jgi:hypothetical protein
MAAGRRLDDGVSDARRAGAPGARPSRGAAAAEVWRVPAVRGRHGAALRRDHPKIAQDAADKTAAKLRAVAERTAERRSRLPPGGTLRAVLEEAAELALLNAADVESGDWKADGGSAGPSRFGQTAAPWSHGRCAHSVALRGRNSRVGRDGRADAGFLRFRPGLRQVGTVGTGGAARAAGFQSAGSAFESRSAHQRNQEFSGWAALYEAGISRHREHIESSATEFVCSLGPAGPSGCRRRASACARISRRAKRAGWSRPFLPAFPRSKVARSLGKPQNVLCWVWNGALPATGPPAR